MSRDHVGHSELVAFARDRVNLPKDKADEYRAQAGRLQTKLEHYLDKHPNFELRRMVLSGSLAKGTALRALNDIDVAAYVTGVEAPRQISELLNYLAERLRSAFPNFKPDQVQPQTYSVCVSFRGSGLDVDIVPILYFDDPEWRGHLVSQDDGTLLETSIPLHLDFARKRKSAQPTHYAQLVRLAKQWVRHQKAERPGFRFKSFLVELVMSHLSDEGGDLSDYVDGLQHFFTYLAKTDLKERIVFSDNYRPQDVPLSYDPVQVIDPVNPNNNAARLYGDQEATLIGEAANDAGDAIDAACHAPTKTETVRYWKQVFGPSFSL